LSLYSSSTTCENSSNLAMNFTSGDISLFLNAKTIDWDATLHFLISVTNNQFIFS